MFGFAPTYRVGRGKGRFSVFGGSYAARYAESAEFEFSSELTAGAARGRG
jgi:hypothetical protein